MGSIDPRKLISIGLRWWWLIIIPPLVAAAVGYHFRPRPKPVYEATTTLRVGQSTIQNFASDFEFLESQELMYTYANMTERYPVLQGVIDTLGLDSNWRNLKGQVEARPVPGTELLEITVTDSSPEEAEAIANELAQQLVFLSQQQDQNDPEEQTFVRERLDRLKVKIEAGQERLDTLEKTLETPLSVEQVQAIQQEMNTLDNLMTGWEANYGQLLTYLDDGTAPSDLTIIEPAIANRRPIQTQPLQYPLVGGALGLCLALGLVYLLETLDDTFKTEEGLTQELDLITLGTVNQIKGSKDYQDKLVTLQDPFSGTSEAYRKIRSNMQFLSVDQPVKSIMVTSASPGEGKSVTVANLGVVMAQAGHKTVIVDADLRRPVQHKIFQVPNLEGLPELLYSPEDELHNHFRKSGVENLLVITCGVIPPFPSELVGSQRMEQVMNNLNQVADVVIYDSPPVLPVTDALVMSSRVDAVVLVVQAGKARRKAVKLAKANLQQAGGNLLGSVLNGISRKGEGEYSYYQYYTPKASTMANQPSRIKSRRRQWAPFFFK